MAWKGAVLVLMLSECFAHLPVGGSPCGDSRCRVNEYCSTFDNHCRPCSDICEETSNNFQASLCKENCQVYIHDRQYEDLNRRVRVLTAVAASALALSALLLICCGALAVAWLRRPDRRLLVWAFAKGAKAKAKAKDNNNRPDAEAGHAVFKTGPLKLDVAAAAAAAGADAVPSPSLSRAVSRDPVTPATTSTPLSRPRHPSEDNTLDYAYDNPGLAPSPGPAPGFGREPSPPAPPQRKESSF